ncbi:hypothetical protein [Rubrivirga sp. IMCC43871]|uniref:hypothetical protein n=1 Tax=Rubrivirga sp. IMCC43871 TaxID=3391575 RepID=UPI00398FCA0A
MSRFTVVLLALLAVSASAQPASPFDARGGFGAYGNAASERMLFPRGSDPALTLGARLSPHVEVQVGVTVTERERVSFEAFDVGVTEHQTRRGGVVAALTTQHPWGGAVIESAMSLGYDDFLATRTEFRPDSVTFPGRDAPSWSVYRLAGVSSRSSRGKYVQAGARAAVGWPLGRGRLRTTPTLGVAGSLAGRVGGTREAQGARIMPYLAVPVTAFVAGVGLTATATLGVGGGTRDSRAGVETFGTGDRPSDWVFETGASFRVDF